MAFVWFACVMGLAEKQQHTTAWQRQEPESDVVSVALEVVFAIRGIREWWHSLLR